MLLNLGTGSIIYMGAKGHLELNRLLQAHCTWPLTLETLGCPERHTYLSYLAFLLGHQRRDQRS